MTPLIFIIFTIYFLILPIYRVHSLISVLHLESLVIINTF